MADQAFALSPISAHATQPSEVDYEAIREAFMETARGRWFLGEYARRNRNADTRMVLDAVARIEQTLETLRQPTEALRQSTPDTRLTEILVTISSFVDQATEMAAAAADGLTIDDRLAPIHRGAMILKEISWRWREIGAETRICDSIESQVDAIQESCSQLARVDTRAAFTAAFELMRARIEALAKENGLAVPPAAKAEAKLHPAESETVVAAEPVQSAPTEPRSYMAPPPRQPELPAAPLSLHSSLGAAPFTAEFQESSRHLDTDPAAAIRRMSLTEKFAFFA